MSDETHLGLLVPRPIRRVPADLAAVVLLTGLTYLAVFAPVLRETRFRIVVAVPFVLFVPGYAIVAALFPEAADVDEGTSPFSDRGIDWVTRIALSLATSLAVVPLVGLLLNFTPFGIRPLPVLVSTSTITLAATTIATVRRWELPEDERFTVEYERWIATVRGELFDPESRLDAALNVAFVLSLLLAAGSVGYAVTVPKEGESFTELYLLTETETGELVADGYPSELSEGESVPLYVGIENHEHRAVDYTVIVELQRVETSNDAVTVRDAERLHRFEASVEHGETWRTRHEVTPGMSGENLRLVYLLYEGEPPSRATVDSAYHEVHLWLNVTES